MSTCSVPGCKNLAHRRGICQKHAKAPPVSFTSKSSSITTPVKAPKGKVGKSVQPGKEKDILTQMFQRQPVDSPPDTGTQVPPQPSQQPGAAGAAGNMGPAMLLMPLFQMLGHTLAKVTDTKEFELDDESAKYMCNMLGMAAQKHGMAEIDPLWGFIGAIVLWLGGGAAMYALKHLGEDDDKGQGGATNWMDKLKGMVRGRNNPPNPAAGFRPPAPAPVTPAVVGQATATPAPPPMVEPALLPGQEKPWKPMTIPDSSKDKRTPTP